MPKFGVRNLLLVKLDHFFTVKKLKLKKGVMVFKNNFWSTPGLSQSFDSFFVIRPLLK